MVGSLVRFCMLRRGASSGVVSNRCGGGCCVSCSVVSVWCVFDLGVMSSVGVEVRHEEDLVAALEQSS